MRRRRDVDPSRVRQLARGSAGPGPVVFWMSRDQRSRDNWALLFARQVAIDEGRPLVVAFCLVADFLGATERHFAFMLRGLREVEASLRDKEIPFFLIRGAPPDVLPGFLKRHRAMCLVSDFDPLRLKRRWRAEISRRVDIPVYEVDSHNIVPCRVASPKQEYAARTFRPKVLGLLPAYLTDFPPLRTHPHPFGGTVDGTDWESALGEIRGKGGVGPVDWITPGEQAARRDLRRFIREGLRRYAEDRNNPLRDGQSGLSPYLHFGQLSAQRVALEVRGAGEGEAARTFFEELVVRRELADNYCWHQPRYDSVEGFPGWARKTLRAHGADSRPHLYGRRRLEEGRTHDELWNAAQREMVRRGKMHGYLRMYWGKKILEWSRDPAGALKTAIYLNDRYELDGRDPNGYTGIAWSIGGLHDRPWPERSIFGTVRYMSAGGCRSKFDVDAYCRRWRP